MKTKTYVAVMAASIALWSNAGQAGCLPEPPQNVVAYTPIPPPGYVGIYALRTVVLWGDVKTERSYLVERAPWTAVGWGPFATLAEMPRNSTSFTDWQPLVVPCLYRVSSVNPCGIASTVFVFQP